MEPSVTSNGSASLPVSVVNREGMPLPLIEAPAKESPEPPAYLSREDGLEWQSALLAEENAQLRVTIQQQARAALGARFAAKYGFQQANFEPDPEAGLLRIVRK